MLNYLIVGGGYLGQYLTMNLPNAKIFPGYLGDADTLKRLLLKEYPSHILINCAGKTGRPNIDWCEDHKDVTFGGNVGLPVMMAEVCREIKKYWIHIGSGCIYSGYEKEWTEEDPPNFHGSFYSRTKIWSQNILEEFGEVCILRIRMPIDENLEPRCYISKIVKYAQEGKGLFSFPNSMTILSDLVESIKFLSEKGHTGTWNVVNKGGMTIPDILKIYQKHVSRKLRFRVEKPEIIQATLKAERSNCLLSSEKLTKEGFMMPDLKEGIIDILSTLKERSQ